MKCNVTVSSVCTCGGHVGVQKVYTNMAAASLGYPITAQTKSRGLRTLSTISLKVGPIIYFQRIYGLKRSKLHLIKKSGEQFTMMSHANHEYRCTRLKCPLTEKSPGDISALSKAWDEMSPSTGTKCPPTMPGLETAIHPEIGQTYGHILFFKGWNGTWLWLIMIIFGRKKGYPYKT